MPYIYTLEGDVEDVSRQHIANRASLMVHPAPWYIGLQQLAVLLRAEATASRPRSSPSASTAAGAGVPVDVKLTQIQWTSVRRAEGNGFYTWDTERKEVPAGSWTVTTRHEPVPLSVPLPNGGYFILEATAPTPTRRVRGDPRCRSTRSATATPPGQRYDHNRIELVPERRPTSPATPRAS